MSIPILTTVSPGGSPNNYAVTFYASTDSPQPPAKQVTIGQYPESNPGFSRSIQVTGDYLYIKRGNGVIGIPLADLAGIAVSEVPTLSFSPLVTVDPQSASVVAGGSNNVSLTVQANSELTLSFSWYKNNGAAWSSVSNAGVYLITNNTVGSSLKITPTDNTLNGFKYLCTVQNAAGNSNSDYAVLTVT